jgi:hypothetical protein
MCEFIGESESESEDPTAREARMSQMISEGLRIAAALSRQNTESVLPPKPSWWTSPWQKLERKPLPTDFLRTPRVLCPRDLRSEADTGIMALDFYGTRTSINPDVGEDLTGDSGRRMHHGVVGVV